MPTYGKKPIKVEAFKLGSDQTLPSWIEYELVLDKINIVANNVYADAIMLKIRGGEECYGRDGSYIVKDEKGLIFFCHPETFEALFDLLEE